MLGDAELDEGAIWEAEADPQVARLGEVLWVVDLNRQSLDRVVPDIQIERLQGMFAAAGWEVVTLKWGRLVTELFTRPGGASLPDAEPSRCPMLHRGRVMPRTMIAVTVGILFFVQMATGVSGVVLV